MSIKAIIFDFFGVISSEVSPFWFSERFEEAEAKRLKEEYMTPADTGEYTEAELFSALSKLSGEVPEEIESDFSRRAVIDREMTALIEELGKSYKIALLSNASGSWLKKIIYKNGLDRLFDVKIISSELGIAKPNGRIFETALSLLGVKSDEAIFVDDNQRNVDGASNVGILGLLYANIPQLKEQLKKLKIKT